MKNVAIIMAGGKGTRFWPMSTSKYPKQFLSLTDSKRTMIQLTLDRIKPLIKIEDVYIVTNSDYKEEILKQLPNIPEKNLIFEPVGRNTAPCIALATAVIKKRYKDANVLVLPSDHVINNSKLFIENLSLAIKRLMSDNIITIGIVPSRIETGYGYIQIGKKDKQDLIFEADKFVEKPKYELAKKYYESNDFLWNSGIFIWRNSFMDSCINEYIPDTYKKIQKIYDAVDTKNFEKVLNNEFPKVESISIDFAVLEKVKKILVIPGTFGWDDVGSWLAIERLKTPDSNKNILDGRIVSVDSNNNIIINNDNETLLATSGLNNLLIVKTKGVVMIMNKDNIPNIMELIESVKLDDKNKDFL